MEKVLLQQALNRPRITKVITHAISIEQRSDEILNYFQTEKCERIMLSNLLKHFSHKQLITTFLAVLELAKVSEINLHQEVSFADISIIKVGR